MAQGRNLYLDGERALCFHGPLIYEAKILKIEDRKDKGPYYFVHYKGWKQTWDEWVPESRLLKLNEENQARQKQLMDAQLAKDRAERDALHAKEKEARHQGGASGTANGTGSRRESGAPRGQKRARESAAATGDPEDEHLKRPSIKLPIPDELKIRLVDEWEAITKNSQLVPLPRTPNVQQILQEFETHITNTKGDRAGRSSKLNEEFTSGLQTYFNKCLGNNLLYRFERIQYSEMRKKHGGETGDDFDASAIYGAEHLLRLFVSLPELLAHTTMDIDTVGVLRNLSWNFLQWLAKNDKLFLPASRFAQTSNAQQALAKA